MPKRVLRTLMRIVVADQETVAATAVR